MCKLISKRDNKCSLLNVLNLQLFDKRTKINAGQSFLVHCNLDLLRLFVLLFRNPNKTVNRIEIINSNLEKL